MAKVMKESGFKVYENFQTSRHIIDIYGVLPTILGDFGVVVTCKNYDERWDVGLDVLKEMEMVAKTLKASKIVVVTSSYFTNSAVNYASRRNIKLIDKDGLINLARKFSKREETPEMDEVEEPEEEFISRPSSSPSFSFFKREKISLNKGTLEEKRPSSLKPKLMALIGNTISLIIIVLILSSLLTYLFTLGTNNASLVGIYKIVFSAILSYGLVLVFQRDISVILIKGTTIFFVSLLLYMVLILLNLI